MNQSLCDKCEDQHKKDKSGCEICYNNEILLLHEIRLQNNSLEPTELPYLLCINRIMHLNNEYCFLDVTPIPIIKDDIRKFKEWNDVSGSLFATALPSVVGVKEVK